MLQITPQERLALGVVALLLTLGAGARMLALERTRAAPIGFTAEVADTPGQSAPGPPVAAVEGELARERVRSTPLAPGERIDPNRASVDELMRLPRVGPKLAGRIVEHREAHGAFRTLEDLDAVPGIGPAMLRGMAPHLALAPAPPAKRGGDERLDLNRATVEELEGLPGIGRVLAERIVAWREAHGRFRSVEELEAVPGIGPGLRARLAPRVRVGP